MEKTWTKKLGVPLILLALTTFSGSFDPDVNILEKKEITVLNDEALVNTYMDVLVEIEASRTFHTTSGFTPKDYRTYKSLLKFRLLLIQEAHTRGLEFPKFE